MPTWLAGWAGEAAIGIGLNLLGNKIFHPKDQTPQTQQQNLQQYQNGRFNG